MIVIDLLIVALILGMLVWGFREGLSVRALSFVGFAAGAVLGSRLAPLVLDDGIDSTYAPIIALPAALIAGGLLAALFERVSLRLRPRHESHLGLPEGIAGAVLAGVLGLTAAWIVGAIVTQVDSLEDDVARSEILDRMNSTLPPPGPVVAAEARPTSPIPTFEGKPPAIGRPNPVVAKDPDVQRAMRSLIKVSAHGCGHGAIGSGWVAGVGIVATNAHVVAGADTIGVQILGEGETFPATPVWFDKKRDLALLRSHEARAAPVLPMAPEPERNIDGAILGFPDDRREIRAARLGPAGATEGRVGGRAVVDEDQPVIPFVGRTQGGNSGGPIVDTRGRVRTTVFGKLGGRNAGYGVPNKWVLRGLRRAGPVVKPGDCDDQEELTSPDYF